MSQPSATRKRPEPSGNRTTKTRSSADPAFEQNMIDAGIYPHNRHSKPENLGSIRGHLARSRASLSPSVFRDEDFEEFVELADRASGETSVRTDVITLIEGSGRKQHRHGADHVFNNLEPLDEDLPKPKPDQYDGAQPESIERCVRRDLGQYIVPCTNTARPAVPNFILEAKGDGGRADILKRQACHHGALGARAVHQLDNYQAAEPQYNHHAKSFSSTYHHGTSTLALYSHHITQPKVPGGQPEYHMTKLDGFDMTGNPRSFREGATALRNLRDLSQTYRNSAINHANQVARHAPTDSPLTLLTDSQTSLSAAQDNPSDSQTSLSAAQDNTSDSQTSLSAAQDNTSDSQTSLSAAQDNTSDTSGYETPDEYTTAKRSRHDGPVHPRASPVAATPGSVTSSGSRHDADTLVTLS
ncbi:hypothetical protein DV735_g3372, partial [Chaetothyriales sp. CBS 134920]